jgi:hypothetical protein
MSAATEGAVMGETNPAATRLAVGILAVAALMVGVTGLRRR